jgi:CBS domain containing-hemolysin-like protein
MKESRAGGVITAGEAEIIHRAFEFADNTAAEMMIPAEHVEYLSLARSIEENVAVATRSQHTRFPLCTTELDSVIGIVNMKDAWPRLAEQRSNAMLQHVSRPVTWIERGMPQDRVLQRLQQQKAHMGCVRRDRHGGVLGVITLEEVLDALLGDLREGRG